MYFKICDNEYNLLCRDHLEHMNSFHVIPPKKVNTNLFSIKTAAEYNAILRNGGLCCSNVSHY